MKSGTIFKNAYLMQKNSLGLLFISVLCLESIPVIMMVWISIIKNVPNHILSLILKILLFALSMLLFCIYFIKRKSNPESSEVIAQPEVIQQKGENLIFSLAGVVAGISFLGLLSFFANLASKNLIPVLYANAIKSPGKAVTFFLLLAVFILLVLLLITAAFIVFATSYRNRISIQELPGWFASAVLQTIRRLPAALAIITAQAATISLLRFTQTRIMGWMSWLFPDSLAERIVSIMLLSALEAIVLQYCINTAILIMEDVRPAQRALRLNTKSYLVISLVLLIILAGIGMTIQSVSGSPLKAYYQIMDAEISAGDLLLMEPNRMDLAAGHFRKAYAQANALQGYANTLLFKKEPGNQEYGREADACFYAAIALDKANPFLYLFQGYLAELRNNPGEALRCYKISRSLEPNLPDSALRILKLAYNLKDKKLVGETLDDVVYQGFTSDFFNRMDNLGRSTLEATIKTSWTYIDSLKERMFMSILEKMKVKDMQRFFQDAATLLKANPGNPTALFLQGLAAMAWRNETYNYPLAESSFAGLDALMPENLNIQEYYSRVLLFSKQYKKAADFYKRLFEKYPENYILGEQYAYSLLAGNQDADAIEVCDRILKQYDDDWFCHYVRAVALIKLNRFAESITAIGCFLKLTDSPLHKRSRDTFLNAYMMTYAPATKNPGAVAALKDDGAKGLIADYALGITAWKDKDYPLALGKLDNVLKEYPDLGYVWYAKGCILNEKLKIDKSAGEDEAEACYLKCAGLEPQSLEVWFSLGNLYKTWKGHEKEALRAFRRVIDLEPSSDHSYDFYGVVIHSYWAVKELMPFDK